MSLKFFYKNHITFYKTKSKLKFFNIFMPDTFHVHLFFIIKQSV